MHAEIKEENNEREISQYRIFTSSLGVRARPKYSDSTDSKDSISHLVSMNVADD